ncbi:MAG: peptidylprolyl isomerase [Novosphingobium sp.]|nr:peptidylprolyl isomerase [Novosphingobium sp.]
MTIGLRGARLLREPLVHFIALGALVFALFGNATSADERRIVIDAARIERIAGQYAQNFRRAPSAVELDALIRDDVKEEVYYREALRLGLDRDDEVVRRRMRVKMEAFGDTAAEIAPPDDATLQRWLDAHPARFAGEASYAFDQRYLGTDGAAPQAGLDLLRAGKGFAGAAIPLPASFEAIGAGEAAVLFGDDFPAVLDRLPLGVWSGPVGSGLGQHLVRVRKRQPADPPGLAQIRQRVDNDWRAAMAQARGERAYRALLQRYDVVIEKPE